MEAKKKAGKRGSLSRKKYVLYPIKSKLGSIIGQKSKKSKKFCPPELTGFHQSRLGSAHCTPPLAIHYPQSLPLVDSSKETGQRYVKITKVKNKGCAKEKIMLISYW